MKLKKVSLLIVAAIAGVSFYTTVPSLFAQTTSPEEQPRVKVHVPEKVVTKGHVLAVATPQDLAVVSSTSSQDTEQKQVVATIEQQSTPVTTTEAVTSNSTPQVNSQTSATENQGEMTTAQKPEVTSAEQSHESMLQEILSKAGITNQASLTIIDEGITDNSFQISIRANSTDPQVLSLVGIYRYDTQTGTVSKQDYLTGEFQGL